MANTVGDCLALAAGTIAFLFVLRTRRTYFLDSRFFIGIANAAFNIIIIQDLFSDLENTPPSEVLFTGLIAVTAISIGFASYLLTRGAEHSEAPYLKAFLSNPPKQFLFYTVMVLAWAAFGIIFAPWSLEPSLASQGVFHYSYESWYLWLSAFLAISFVGLPVRAVYRQSRGLSDSKESRSLKVISLSWAGFGIVSFLQVALAETQTAGMVTEGVLFIAIAFALREPTMLSRIMSSVSPSGLLVHSFPNTDTVVLYNTDSDRRNLVESFAREELAEGHRSACLVARAEVPFYTAILKGLTSKRAAGENGSVQVLPIEDLLRGPAQEMLLVLANMEGELVDLGELDESKCRLIVERTRQLDALERMRKIRVWAVDVGNAHPELLSMIRTIDPKTRTIDQAGHQDAFASVLGTRHRNIVGSKLLVEFEPSSLFEKLIERFVEEFQANMETVAVFTSVGSPVHKEVRRLHDVRLFTFSTKTSTPSRGPGEEVLLPERDSSLLLDAIDKLLQATRGQNIGLVLDVFTDLVLLQGFDKAYGVLSSVMEMLESESIASIVMVNSAAHDERILQGIRGLFRSRIVSDSNGVRLARFSPIGEKGSDVETLDLFEARSQGVSAN